MSLDIFQALDHLHRHKLFHKLLGSSRTLFRHSGCAVINRNLELETAFMTRTPLLQLLVGGQRPFLGCAQFLQLANGVAWNFTDFCSTQSCSGSFLLLESWERLICGGFFLPFSPKWTQLSTLNCLWGTVSLVLMCINISLVKKNFDFQWSLHPNHTLFTKSAIISSAFHLPYWR